MIKLLILAVISLRVDTLFIPWGSEEGKLGVKVVNLEDAGPNYGPGAFDVDDGRIVFIDDLNSRISFFDADGRYLESYNIKGYFTNIALWQGKVILSADYYDSLKFLIIDRSKATETYWVRSKFPFIRNSVEFFKDYRKRKLYITYQILTGCIVRTHYTVFDGKIGKFKKGDLENWEDRYTVLGYDSTGEKILVRFDGYHYIFKRGDKVFKWKPVFFAQMDGAPYRMDREGTLYIVNYKEDGVEILEVKW